MKWLDPKTHPMPKGQDFIAYIDLRFHSDPNEYAKELIQSFVTVGGVFLGTCFADLLNTTYGEPLYYSIETIQCWMPLPESPIDIQSEEKS